MTGAELLGIVRTVAMDELRRRGAYVGDRLDDLVGFLVAAGCKAAIGYDPNHPQASYGRNGGDPFRNYIADIMHRRLYDWYRSRAEGFSDRRYRTYGEVVPTTDETLAQLTGGFDLVSVDEFDLTAAAVELGNGLSEEARVTLDIAVSMARGYHPNEIARATGIGPTTQRSRLDALREELVAVGVTG